MKRFAILFFLLISASTTYANDATSAASAFDAKDWTSAAGLYKPLTQAEPNNALFWFRLGYASRQIGQLAEAKAALTKASELGFQPMYIGLNLAAVDALSGEKASALDRLEKLAASGAPLAALIESDSAFRSLSSEPRYAKALESMKEQAAPCTYRTKGPEYRQFDFWVGEWDVYGKAGQKSGTSRIDLILGDCVISENWTDSTGGQGKSYNKYNAPLKRWEQYWVDQYGTTTYYIGNLEGTNMVFLADGFDPAGKPAKLRMTFFPLGPDKVRQFGETSADDGKTWTTSFDLTYIRRK